MLFKNPCSNRKVFLTIPAILVVISILAMVFFGFNEGIDFTSGTTFEIEHMPAGFVYDGELEVDVKAIVTGVNEGADPVAQAIGTDGVFIKAKELTNEETEMVVEGLLAYFNGEEVSLDSTDATAAVEVATDVVEEAATEVAVEDATDVAEEVKALERAAISIDKVSATTSARLISDTFFAVLLAIALMLVYIAIRFDFKSGVCAVIALAHDVTLMFGFYSIFQLTMNTSFVAAVLTIIGYSINSTIIVFDRVRENNRLLGKKATWDEKADNAITTSYTRTLYSSLTTLFTIGALFVLGVSSIQEFALPIIVGLVCGAYSSLFVAPTIWAWWKNSSK
ncbi:MAG: protein translocase subunit SecF [Clostridia bacterium]|nr:protein translocase subunit SecF [Clostridia bacterium]